MRRNPIPTVERGRITRGPYGTPPRSGCTGAYRTNLPSGAPAQIIASDGGGWEHVSILLLTIPPRLPTWDDMCHVKDAFWKADEAVVQYHPPRADYVNTQPFTLHLWRPINEHLPTPPTWMVGPAPRKG